MNTNESEMLKASVKIINESSTSNIVQCHHCQLKRTRSRVLRLPRPQRDEEERHPSRPARGPLPVLHHPRQRPHSNAQDPVGQGFQLRHHRRLQAGYLVRRQREGESVGGLTKLRLARCCAYLYRDHAINTCGRSQIMLLSANIMLLHTSEDVRLSVTVKIGPF